MRVRGDSEKNTAKQSALSSQISIPELRDSFFEEIASKRISIRTEKGFTSAAEESKTNK